MKKQVIDTNTLLRFLLQDIPKQAEVTEQKLRQAKSGKVELIIPQIIIFEIVFNLSSVYKFGKEMIIDRLKTILSTPYIKIQDYQLFDMALQIFQKNNIDFVDCFLIAYAKEKDATVFTFDKKLKKVLERLA